MTCRIAIDGLAQRKDTRVRHIKDAPFFIDNAGTVTQSSQCCVVKCLRCFDIIGTDHNVAKHNVILLINC